MGRSFKEFREEINRIFARYTRRGFVDYYNCMRLGRDMVELMEDATEELSARGEYKELFDLANKGFLKWGKTSMDDDGETAEFMYYIEKAWDAVYEANDPKIYHSKMYEWFEKHLDGQVIDYMEERLYEYIQKHFTEPELLQKKYDLFAEKIDECVKNKGNFHFDYRIDGFRRHMLYVMADMKRPIEFIRRYAKDMNPFYSKKAMAEIEKSYGNTDEVIAIYKELAAEEDKRGWASENWHIKLMDIYKKQGREEEYRKELISAMMLNLGNEELWREYKRGFSPEEWPEARDEIFGRVKIGDGRIFSWYEEEGRYDLIMSALEVVFYSGHLKHYEKQLKKLYPERCLKLLVEETERMAEQSDNRRDYKKLAKNLRWIKKYLGGEEKAGELAEKYRDKYKRRKALLEEIAEF